MTTLSIFILLGTLSVSDGLGQRKPVAHVLPRPGGTRAPGLVTQSRHPNCLLLQAELPL